MLVDPWPHPDRQRVEDAMDPRRNHESHMVAPQIRRYQPAGKGHCRRFRHAIPHCYGPSFLSRSAGKEARIDAFGNQRSVLVCYLERVLHRSPATLGRLLAEDFHFSGNLVAWKYGMLQRDLFRPQPQRVGQEALTGHQSKHASDDVGSWSNSVPESPALCHLCIEKARKVQSCQLSHQIYLRPSDRLRLFRLVNSSYFYIFIVHGSFLSYRQ